MTMPYSTGPYSTFSSLPVLPRPMLYSSRSIDAQTKRYEIDGTTGGMVQMSSTVQRVYMLVCFAEHRSLFITPRDQEAERRRIIAALAPLTTNPGAAIELISVTVARASAGRTSREVKFRDLTTGTNETAQG